MRLWLMHEVDALADKIKASATELVASTRLDRALNKITPSQSSDV
jgi:hypothetical protein